MADSRREFGDRGEILAGEYLSSKGIEIVARQYKNFFGEIDLICRDGSEIVFVEVKSRNDKTFGYPEDSVTQGKIMHIIRVGEMYLQEMKLADVQWRIDVVAIEFDNAPPKITHIEGIDISDENW